MVSIKRFLFNIKPLLIFCQHLTKNTHIYVARLFISMRRETTRKAQEIGYSALCKQKLSYLGCTLNKDHRLLQKEVQFSFHFLAFQNYMSHLMVYFEIMSKVWKKREINSVDCLRQTMRCNPPLVNEIPLFYDKPFIQVFKNLFITNAFGRWL